MCQKFKYIYIVFCTDDELTNVGVIIAKKSKFDVDHARIESNFKLEFVLFVYNISYFLYILRTIQTYLENK